MNRLTVILITVAAVPVITAYGDHIDNNIWIETAEGKYVTVTDSVVDSANGVLHANIFKLLESDDACYAWDVYPDFRNRFFRETVTDREFFVNVGDEINGREFLKSNLGTKSFDCDSKASEQESLYHECLCGFWHTNVVKDKYTYTILPLPDYRPLPTGYEAMVKLGVQDGLNQWGDINNITFRYTDSRLGANILVQQQIGDATQYGNAAIGCLFDKNQCTIQLFTDMNVDREQTLVNRESIEFTIAHEFGHLIGLPHHIDPGNVMRTIHANDVRTYYEVGNINVPEMYEPRGYERILGNNPANIKQDQKTDGAVAPGTYGSHSTAIVINRPGSSVPGCEETNDCFIPGTVTIDVGGEVVWKNPDTAAHTVTSGVLSDGGPDGIFDSGLLVPDTNFSQVFDTPGEYPYFCIIHPWMVGMVIVQEAATGGPRFTEQTTIPSTWEEFIQHETSFFFIQLLYDTFANMIDNEDLELGKFIASTIPTNYNKLGVLHYESFSFEFYYNPDFDGDYGEGEIIYRTPNTWEEFVWHDTYINYARLLSDTFTNMGDNEEYLELGKFVYGTIPTDYEKAGTINDVDYSIVMYGNPND